MVILLSIGRAKYLHADGPSNADHDALVVVIDGNKERRFCYVDVEGSKYDLVVDMPDGLFQRGQVTSAARISHHNR